MSLYQSKITNYSYVDRVSRVEFHREFVVKYRVESSTMIVTIKLKLELIAIYFITLEICNYDKDKTTPSLVTNQLNIQFLVPWTLIQSHRHNCSCFNS